MGTRGYFYFALIQLPPCGKHHRTAPPDTTRQSGASASDRLRSPSPGANTAANELLSAGGTAPRLTTRRSAVDQRQPRNLVHGPKKTRSTVSLPIFSYNWGQPRVVSDGTVRGTSLAFGNSERTPSMTVFSRREFGCGERVLAQHVAHAEQRRVYRIERHGALWARRSSRRREGPREFLPRQHPPRRESRLVPRWSRRRCS